MSTLKVNKIRDTSGSADAITLDPSGGAVLAGVTTISTARITTGITTTIQVGGGVTISESGIEASGIGITCANINGGAISGRKNKIINGDFNIHQRGGTITASGAAYTLDRWRTYISGTSPGGFTVQQSTSDYPTTSISGVKDNFKASALITVTSAGAATTDNNVKFQQRIEGNNVYDLAFGTAAAKDVTVSFYVKSSLTGTFGASLVNAAHNRSNIQTYTINSANTWEYKTFTVAGDTSGTWLTTNGTGLQLMFDLGSGSNYSNDTTNQWLSDEYHGTTSSVKLTHTNSATIQFAGVQLEAGTQATAFEHRPIGEELTLCQRYYELIAERDEGSNAKENHIGPFWGDGSNSYTLVTFKVKKRAQPTLLVSDFNNAFRMYGNSGGNNANTLTANTLHRDGMMLQASVNSGNAGYTRIFVDGSDGLKAVVAARAEL